MHFDLAFLLRVMFNVPGGCWLGLRARHCIPCGFCSVAADLMSGALLSFFQEGGAVASPVVLLGLSHIGGPVGVRAWVSSMSASCSEGTPPPPP